MNSFSIGFKKMFPVLTGVIPFGVVFGSVASEAGLSIWKSTLMTLLVYAGASQLAAVDLMTRATPTLIVVVTGLIINLRFLLYSASMASHLRNENFWTKLLSSYWLTDQAHAVMTAHGEPFENSSNEYVRFYLGASTCMFLAWNLSVLAGFLFGNFAPKDWSLDFAVPLSFVVLLTPSIKNKKHLGVAIFSSVASIVFYSLPLRLGLITAAVSAMAFAWFLTRKRAA